MAKNRVLTAPTEDGGVISISPRDNGGFRIEVQRGFKETPAERRERLRLGRRGGFHSDKRVQSRSQVKRDLAAGRY